MSKEGSWNGSSDGPVRALARTGLLKLTLWLRRIKKMFHPIMVIKGGFDMAGACRLCYGNIIVSKHSCAHHIGAFLCIE